MKNELQNLSKLRFTLEVDSIKCYAIKNIIKNGKHKILKKINY